MPIRITFFLVHLFPMYVVMTAADALRLANKHAGKRAFDWRMLSETGKPVQSSNGMWMECDADLEGAGALDYVFVIAGDDQPRKCSRALKDWFIATQRNGATTLGAIDSGVFLLAACRLLGNRRVTVHPDSLNAFQEEYPRVQTDAAVVVDDQGLMTCAGGLSVATLMLTLIERHCGAAVASRVASDLVAGEMAAARQASAATKPRGDTVAAIVNRMQSAIEEPHTLEELAHATRLPVRSLGRLFQDHFGCGPMAYYRRLRLDSAKQLILQSDMAVSDIALATGFQSVSAFSRAFNDQFGQSPRSMLLRVRREGNAANVPAANHKKHIQLGTTRKASG